MSDLEAWISKKNVEYQQREIHPRQRPFQAIEDFSENFNQPVAIPSTISDQIFAWFSTNMPKGSLAIGPIYRGAYYFDSVFWPVEIPYIYGAVRIEPLRTLTTMSDAHKKLLQADVDEWWNFTLLWADCLDYGYGYDDLEGNQDITDVERNWIRSGHKELTACVSMLLQDRPESKSIESSRMAVEIFLKAILVLQGGWDETRIRKEIRHDLRKGVEAAFDCTGSLELKTLEEEYSFFPDIGTRYSGQSYRPPDLWTGYSLAQATGTILIRLHTDRDIRSEL